LPGNKNKKIAEGRASCGEWRRWLLLRRVKKRMTLLSGFDVTKCAFLIFLSTFKISHVNAPARAKKAWHYLIKSPGGPMKCSLLQESFKTQFTQLTKVVSAILALCVLPSCLLAQVNQARMLGTVADQSGGVIVGASVTITDVQKNVSRTLTTDSAGEYVAPNLDPDTYTLRVESKGFKTFTREGMQLGVGQDARVDVALQPGEQTQTITVTEALPLIDTTTATLTGSIDNETVNEVPLNGRNYYSEH
jgi:hypothetical protein